jgi:PBP1b-binding outer membrane lipoprotein LpoB
MKIIATFFLIIFILSSCGKKSEPKYQGKINQINIIS